MSNYRFIVDRQARSLASALVRDVALLEPINAPELVIGSSKAVRIEVVSGGTADTISGHEDYTPTLSIGRLCAYPESGTFTLNFSGQTTGNLAYNITPEALKTALEALSTIDEDNVIVRGVAGVFYEIEFTNTLELADQPLITAAATSNSLVPESSVLITEEVAGSASTNEVQLIRLRQKPLAGLSTWTASAEGWNGTLSITDFSAYQELASNGSFTGILEIKVTGPTGTDTLAQVPVTVFCDVGDSLHFA